jgi:hypothetical protein
VDNRAEERQVLDNQAEDNLEEDNLGVIEGEED